MAHFLKPELFKKRKALGSNPATAAGLLLKHATDAQKRFVFEPPIAVLIRTKNDEQNVTLLLNYIQQVRRSYKGRIDVVVVDTESQDKTIILAKEFGATVVPILQKDFTYPKGINLGLQAVKPDVVAAFITVGHALPVLDVCLKAGVWHFNDPAVVGVYGQVLPNTNASFGESLYWGKSQFRTAARPIVQSKMGVMGATNCMVRMESWLQQPFDQAYAMGGEDTAWADWALNNGHKIIFEPLLSVHHSHGLGPLKLLKQHAHWRQVSKQAVAFDQNNIRSRRPDLFK